MKFQDVIGQDVIKKELIHLFQQSLLPHALLITAKPGYGGLPIALSLAQFMMCENKLPQDACGTCSTCIKTQKLVHPDMHLSFPAIVPKPGSKPLSKYFVQDFRTFVAQHPYGSTYDWLQYINAENKQGNIPADECRAIIENLNLKAFESEIKIQIIWRPEYLGNEGNILLKLMEEPPQNTYLILIAEEAEKILPTILSRTQLINIPPIKTEDIIKALIEKQQIEYSKANHIAHMAEGSYAHALTLQQYTGNDLLPELTDWFNALFTNNGIEVMKWVDNNAKIGREQIKNFLKFTQQMIAQTLRMNLINQFKPSLPNDELQFINKLVQKNFTFEVFQLMNESVSKTIYHIERNAHIKTQLMALSIQMQYHIKERKLTLI